MSESNFESLLIENQICFPLYVCAKEWIKVYTSYLDELGLTYTQFITMMVLWEQKSLTVKELGKSLFLDSGTLTPLLKKLEEKGFVTRRRSLEDERNLIVTITEQGEALKQRAIHIPRTVKEQIRISHEDAEIIRGVLNRALAGLSRQIE